MELVASGNLFSFFYDRLKAAREIRGTQVEEETEFYLVNLLVDFGHSNRLLVSGGARVDDRPMAIRLLETRSAGPQARFRELKHLADSTLYLLGFFAESMRRGAVGLGYYSGVAETAYGALAGMAARRRGAPDPVFSELAERFDDCVELLSEVRDDSCRTDSDVLALFDRWMASGSETARRRLAELGVLPARGVPGADGGAGH